MALLKSALLIGNEVGKPLSNLDLLFSMSANA